MLEDSGIRYPDGYDPNTVGEISGRAFGLSMPDRGPVTFRIQSSGDTYTVLVSPAWFWKDIDAGFRDGEEVRIRGSKSLGRDGNLYIVAQELRLMATGRSMVFRGEDGFPFWKRPSSGPTERGGGIGPPMRGIGMEGGFHGFGHGRR